MNILLRVEQGNEIFYTTLLGFGLIIIIGLFFGKLFERFKLPNVTGYLIAGILIGPSVFGLITKESLNGLEIITNIALGFIAYGIGAEILFKNLKQTGVQVIVITILQAIAALTFVLIFLLLFNAPLWLALVLGSIATATAPGPIMMLTKKFRTQGPVTRTLLPLVGLDDAIGIIVFGILLSIGSSIYTGVGESIFNLIKKPLIEILLSIIVGVVIGLLVKLVLKLEKHYGDEFLLVVSVTAIIVSVAIAELGLFGEHLSIILTPMAAGITLANTINDDELRHTIDVIDCFNPVILIAFFTMAGSNLDLKILGNLSGGSSLIPHSVALIGVVYIIARSFGKVFGAWVGALISKADENVRKWLGITLLPQAGVAIGMANAAKSTLGGEAGSIVLTIVLSSTVFFAIFGPIGCRIALFKSGEVNVKEY